MPGRSYGISIARRLRLPDDVVARAEERIPQGERDMAALIERLERRRRSSRTREREAAAMLDDARERIADVVEREHNVRERERTVEKQSRQDARKYVLEARAEIERTIKELKSRARAADEAIDELGATRAGAPRSSRRSRRRARPARARGGAVERADGASRSAIAGPSTSTTPWRSGRSAASSAA